MSSTCGPGYNTYWSDSPTVLNTISSSMDSISMGNHTSMIWELQAQALPKLHENTCHSIALVPWPHSQALISGTTVWERGYLFPGFCHILTLITCSMQTQKWRPAWFGHVCDVRQTEGRDMEPVPDHNYSCFALAHPLRPERAALMLPCEWSSFQSLDITRALTSSVSVCLSVLHISI